MKKTGIFYGTTTGTTEDVARRIGKALGVTADNIYDVAKTAPSRVGDYDVIILGASTWGHGDLQPDMDDFLRGVEVLDLKGKDVAVFGCGDDTMADTFCNGVGEMYDRLKGTGAKMIGDFGTIGYTFTDSKAVPKDAAEAEGLLIDDVNHSDMTSKRVYEWAAELVKEE